MVLLDKTLHVSIKSHLGTKTLLHTRARLEKNPTRSRSIKSLSPVSVWGLRRPLHMILVFQNGHLPAEFGPQGKKRRGQRVILWLCLLSSFGPEFNKDRAEPASMHCVCVTVFVSVSTLNYKFWLLTISRLVVAALSGEIIISKA